MEGVPISKFMGQETDSSLKTKLSLLCCDLLLQMVFVNNFVHGMYYMNNFTIRYLLLFIYTIIYNMPKAFIQLKYTPVF